MHASFNATTTFSEIGAYCGAALLTNAFWVNSIKELKSSIINKKRQKKGF